MQRNGITLRCGVCGSPFYAPRWRLRRQGKTLSCSNRCRAVMMSAVSAIPPEDRFARYVPPDSGGCLEWLGARGQAGHGRFSLSGGKSIAAHRYAWERIHGPIPVGMEVCHHCDNPPCVRVEHLFLGTHADNMADMVAKKRQATGDRHGTRTHPERTQRGERCRNAKLTSENAAEIRSRYAGGGFSYARLATEYGVSATTVRVVVTGRAWREH